MVSFPTIKVIGDLSRYAHPNLRVFGSLFLQKAVTLSLPVVVQDGLEPPTSWRNMTYYSPSSPSALPTEPSHHNFHPTNTVVTLSYLHMAYSKPFLSCPRRNRVRATLDLGCGSPYQFLLRHWLSTSMEATPFHRAMAH